MIDELPKQISSSVKKTKIDLIFLKICKLIESFIKPANE
jgi:hypothetical protein